MPTVEMNDMSIEELVRSVPKFRDSLHGGDDSPEHEALLQEVHAFASKNIYRGYELTDISKGTELVLEGGGVKGIIYVGMLQALSELKSTVPGKEHQSILQTIEHVVGTSAGSITASLIAIGASPKQTLDIMQALDFNDFKDRRFWWFTSAYNYVFGKKGIYNGDKLEATLGDIYNKVLHEHLEDGSAANEQAKDLIRQYLHNNKGQDIPLGFIKQLHEADPLNFKLPIIKACDLDSRAIINYDARKEEYQNIKLKFATAASSSIPYYFCHKTDAEGHKIVDGGLAENDGDREVYRYVKEGGKLNIDRIINARVESTAEMAILVNHWNGIDDSEHKLQVPIEHDKKFLQYTKDVLGMALNGQFFEFKLSPNRRKYSLIFSSGDVSTTEFNLSQAQQKDFVEEGYMGTMRRHAYGVVAQNLFNRTHIPLDILPLPLEVEIRRKPVVTFADSLTHASTGVTTGVSSANDAVLEQAHRPTLSSDV